ncbi:MAG: YncE family protein [Phycisphaerales bacterium]|nr:YncE family protein [Phycisphaerales bacterium]
MLRALPLGLTLPGLTLTGLTLAGLTLAGQTAPAAAQPVTTLRPEALLDTRAAPVSPDGDVPVGAWTLRGREVRTLVNRSGSAGRGACAPFAGVGTDPEGDSAAGAAFGPDGSWFVLAHRDSHNLLVYDADTRALIREIPLSGSPSDLAVSADGHWAVTPNLYEDTASIVDLDSGAEVAVVPVGDGPIEARITPDGTRALVVCMVSGEAVVIDLASGTELRRVGGLDIAVSLSANFETFAVSFACANPMELAGSSLAVFPDLYNDRIGFVDLDAGTVDFISTSDSPRAVAVRSDGAAAVVTHAFGSSNSLDVVDIATRTITKSINVGTALYGPVSLDPAGTKAAVAVQNAVRMVDLGTGAVGSNLNTASVNGLITTGDGLYAMSVGFRGSLISYATGTIVKDLNNFVSCSIGAVSPADPRGVMVATTFGEDMVVVNTNGSSGFLEEARSSGPPPEGDKPRTIAVSPDAGTVVTTNQFSRNASVFDASSMAMLGYVDTGLRPGQVKITPDGTRAVVTNRDDTFVRVIDLGSLTSADVTISTRGDQLEISPDGKYAYIAVVTSDGVWRVNLQTLAVEGSKLATGDMGGVGYTGSQFSGMTLSHDGATLVTCNSFTDTLTLIDTSSWSVVATVAVGDFPTAATFSPDDSRIYATNRTDETVSIVSNAGAGSVQIGVVGVGAYPYTSVTNADGSKLYVMNTSDKDIGVVDTASMSALGAIAVSETPIAILGDDAGGRVLVGIGAASASTNGDVTQSGELAVIETASDTVVETVCADHFLSDLAADAGFRLAAAAGLGGESAVFFDIARCPQDLNRDGSVNTQDVILFLNLWVAQDDAADWDHNGVVDTRDFISFLNAWVAGC